MGKLQFLLFVFSFSISFAQEDSLYPIKSKQDLLAEFGGTEIEFLKKDYNSFYYKIKDGKSKKWAIYLGELDREGFNPEANIVHRISKIEFSDVKSNDLSPFFIVSSKNKFGIHHPISIHLIESGLSYNQTYPFNEIVISEFDEIFVRIGKKWGMIGPFKGNLVTECIYTSPQHVPTDNVAILEPLNGIDYKSLTFQNEIIYLIKDLDTKKWGAFQTFEFEIWGAEGEVFMHSELRRIIEPKFDSITTFEGADFFVVQEDNHFGICFPAAEEVFQRVDCVYDEIVFKTLGNVTGIIGSIKGKFGQINVLGENDPTLFTYSSVEEVPLNDYRNPYEARLKVLAMSGLNADRVEMDPINGDGIFRARNKSSKKWGMYQSIDSEVIKEMIPCAYDSIGFFAWNGDYVVVYNAGKMGLYLSPWAYNEYAKQSVPCIYDEYQWFEADGRPRLACKRDNKWGWVNWFTGKEETEFVYNTAKQIPYPTYHQQTTIEE